MRNEFLNLRSLIHIRLREARQGEGERRAMREGNACGTARVRGGRGERRTGVALQSQGKAACGAWCSSLLFVLRFI